jgi:hypothetical protein
MKTYEQINEFAMDILFSFKEFEKFKEKMLTYKKGMVDENR